MINTFSQRLTGMCRLWGEEEMDATGTSTRDETCNRFITMIPGDLLLACIYADE